MARLIAAALLVAALSLIHPGAAYPLPGDPPAGSPGGVVYELPVERGRLDAAPVSRGGAAGGGTAAAGGGASADEDESSLYRTENNFGSSAIVPGTAADGGSDSGRSGDSGGGRSGDGSTEGGNGRPGGGSGRPGGGIAEGEQSDTRGEPGGQTAGVSVAPDIGLLGAIALLAALSGIAAGRAGRADRPS